MQSELVELARFPSSAEASIVRARLECEGIRAALADEAAASWLWHLRPAIGGVRLLVKRDDADRALEILQSRAAGRTDQDDAEPGEDADASGLPDDLIRAWRAAMIGTWLFPPLLNIYSTWLLLQHRFFVGRCRNWRVPAACLINAAVFIILFVLITRAIG